MGNVMDAITHVRIDDRLIHGQVAAFWTNSLGVNRIMVANDDVVNNPEQKELLRMVAPSGVSTSIITKDLAINNLLKNKYVGQKILLILKNPQDAIYLIEKGVGLSSINVGNLGKRENTYTIKKSIHITHEEYEAFNALIKNGVSLSARMVPDETDSNFVDFLNKYPITI